MADETTTSQEAEETQIPQGTEFEDGQEDQSLETPSGETPADTSGDDNPPTSTPQDKIEKKINKLTYDRHEANRKAQAAEAKLAEAEARIKEFENPDKDVTIPEMPDSFDPDYATKLAARDEALKNQASVEARRELAKVDQQKAYQATLEENQKAIQQDVDGMFKRASETGIKEDDLKKADDTVARFIRTPELARFIISHERSPQLVTFLAANAEVLTKLSQMSPVEASAYLVTEIVPKTDSLMPKRKPGAPPPTDIPTGKAAGKQSSAFLEGVTFE